MNQKDKVRLNNFIISENKSLQKQILNVCELVFPKESANWITFRKQILDIINDRIRNIQNEIKYNYFVEYKPSDIIKIYNNYTEYNNRRGKEYD